MSEKQRDKWEQLGVFIQELMNEKGIPGIAVGLMQNGECSTAGFGVTNVDHPLPVTPETLFQIGSITKTFTATVIMRLEEMEMIALDDPVRSIVPDFRVVDEKASAQVTVRHLLTHTSGWVGDFFADTGAGDDALQRYVDKMAGLSQLAPLGSAFSYNNAGFALAGRVIELVTGQSYEAALSDLLLEPLGLKQVFLKAGDVMTHRFACGHREGEEGAVVARPWPLPRYIGALGGIICGLPALLAYARFQMGDGRAPDGSRLLSEESLRQMQSAQVSIWKDEYRGLAWKIDDGDGVREISHGGGTVGQVSLLSIVPEYDFALVVLTNHDNGGAAAEAIKREAWRLFLGRSVSMPQAQETADDELAAYAGLYSRPYADLELGFLAGRLIGQVVDREGFPSKNERPQPAPPPATLQRCAKDRLIVVDGPMKGKTIDVIRHSDGRIGWLRFSGRLHVRKD